MTITKSLTRNPRQIKKAITPIAIAKLQAFESLYRHCVKEPVDSRTWSETQPNTMIAKSWREGGREGGRKRRGREEGKREGGEGGRKGRGREGGGEKEEGWM